MGDIDTTTEAVTALAAAATPGPWEPYYTTHGDPFVIPEGRYPSSAIATVSTGPDDYGRANCEWLARAPGIALALVAERDEARAEVQALREAFESLPGEIVTVLHQMKRASAPAGVALSMTGHGSVIVEVGGRFAASLGYAPARRGKESWSAHTDDGYASMLTATGPTLQAVLDKVLAAAGVKAPAAGTDGGA